MAGMDAGEARGGGASKKKKKHKRMRRLGIRMDMTPMVDVAFLLLTFFMLTTTMNRPQTMEINLPPEKTTVEVAQSNLLTLRVKEDGSIYWNIAEEPPAKVEYKDLRTMMAQKLQQNPKLITLIKVDRKGKYHMMVDIMDELNLANITRFSLAPMADADKQLLAKVAS
ncbi:MAG TPA: biopolymer transporter ExbD [Bacteroidota bacterium]|jgi:biopolymer transport protein ExbD|nr:biopolymer transporter ExbD [Bacteroidota bacterium]